MPSQHDLRDVPGYEGLYGVSIDGRVWSHPKSMGPAQHFGKWLCPGIRRGYRYVELYKSEAAKSFSVHRLVALAWVPNSDPERLTLVNHIDGDTTNNRADNLEWCDHAHNLRHAYKVLGRKTRQKLTDVQIAEARRLVADGELAARVAERFGVAKSTMSAIVNGRVGKEREAVRWKRKPRKAPAKLVEVEREAVPA